MKALGWPSVLLVLAASCESPPEEASGPGRSYEFLGTLRSIGGMARSGENLTVTTSPDPRWVTEFSVNTVVRGSPPRDEQGRVRYAIHSPSHLDLDGRVGSVFRVRGEVVRWRGSGAHEIRVEPQ